MVHAYIVVTGDITAERAEDRDKYNRNLIYNAEDLDIVMPMYNLIKYSKNIEKQQVVCEIIIEMSPIILLLIIIMKIL